MNHLVEWLDANTHTQALLVVEYKMGLEKNKLNIYRRNKKKIPQAESRAAEAAHSGQVMR